MTDLRQQLAATPGAGIAVPSPAQIGRDADAIRAAPGAGVASTAPALVSAAPGPSDRAHGRHVAGWLSLAGGVGSLGTAIVFNVVARGKMNDCYRLFDAGVDPPQAPRPL